jgi:hypothetical protein
LEADEAGATIRGLKAAKDDPLLLKLPTTVRPFSSLAREQAAQPRKRL